jgi:hypothetical protein
LRLRLLTDKTTLKKVEKMKTKLVTLIMLLAAACLLLHNPASNRTMAITGLTQFSTSSDPRGPQITVPVGTTVKVYVKISGPAGTSGTLKVEIRKDIVYESDQTKAWLSQSVTIPSSGITDWIMVGTFVADELTTGQPHQLREYFMKVYWGDTCIYDPTDPNTREWVKTYSPTVTYQAGEFEG